MTGRTMTCRERRVRWLPDYSKLTHFNAVVVHTPRPQVGCPDLLVEVLTARGDDDDAVFQACRAIANMASAPGGRACGQAGERPAMAAHRNSGGILPWSDVARSCFLVAHWQFDGIQRVRAYCYPRRAQGPHAAAAGRGDGGAGARELGGPAGTGRGQGRAAAGQRVHLALCTYIQLDLYLSAQ